MKRVPWRPLDGVLLLDKATGVSSNTALQRVRRLFRAEKAGHTGTLDPLATGVLPICFGEATKFSAYLLEADKTYEVEARLGVVTDSGDSDGVVVAERPVPVIDADHFQVVVRRFVGDIEQVPPMYSALKVGGRKLYELARAGEVVERQPRCVTIHSIAVISLAAQGFRLSVTCSKGTYIRTLVEDIGEALGCGAHVTALRRTATGGFTLAGCVTEAAIEALPDEAARDACLLSSDVLVAHLPEVLLDERQSQSIIHGQHATIARLSEAGLVRLRGPQGFLGLGECVPGGKVVPKRLRRFGA